MCSTSNCRACMTRWMNVEEPIRVRKNWVLLFLRTIGKLSEFIYVYILKCIHEILTFFVY